MLLSEKNKDLEEICSSSENTEDDFDLLKRATSPVLESVFSSNKNFKTFASSTPAGSANGSNKTPNLILNVLDKLCSPIKDKNSIKTNCDPLINTKSSSKRLFSNTCESGLSHYPPPKKRKLSSNVNKKHESSNISVKPLNDNFSDHDISDNMLQILCEATDHIVNNKEEKEIIDSKFSKEKDYTDKIKLEGSSCSDLKNANLGLRDINKCVKVIEHNKSGDACHLLIYPEINLKNEYLPQKISLNDLLSEVKCLEDANKYNKKSDSNITKNYPTSTSNESANNYIGCSVNEGNYGFKTFVDSNVVGCENMCDSFAITDTQICEAVSAVEIMPDLDLTVNSFTCNIKLIANEDKTLSSNVVNTGRISMYSDSLKNEANDFKKISDFTLLDPKTIQCPSLTRYLNTDNKSFSNQVLFSNTLLDSVHSIEQIETYEVDSVKFNQSQIDPPLTNEPKVDNNFIIENINKKDLTHDKITLCKPLDFDFNLVNNTNEFTNKWSHATSVFKGFSTANGKTVNVSKLSLNKAKKLLLDDSDYLNVNTFGLRTAITNVAPNELANNVKICNNSTEDKNGTHRSLKIIPVDKGSTIPLASFKGFQTAYAKAINVSEDAIRASKQLLDSELKVSFLDAHVLSTSNNETEIDATKKIDDTSMLQNLIVQSNTTLSGKDKQYMNNALLEVQLLETELSAKDSLIHDKVAHIRGFETASGNAVEVSETSLKKARSLLNGEIGTDISNFVSEKVLDKHPVHLNKLLNSKFKVDNCEGFNIDHTKSTCEIKDLPKQSFTEVCKTITVIPSKCTDPRSKNNNLPKFKFSGFETGVLKDIEDSGKCLTEGVDENVDIISSNSSSEQLQFMFETDIYGFQTASGKAVKISQDSLQKARKSLKEDVLLEKTEVYNSKPLSDESSIINNGVKSNVKALFCQTAGSNNIEISEQSITKAKCILENEFKLLNSFTKRDVEQIRLGRSKTTPDLSVKVTEEESVSIEKKVGSFKTNDISNDDRQQIQIESSAREDNVSKLTIKGFQTASGYPVNISQESLNKAKHLLEENYKLGDATACGKSLNILNEDLQFMKTGSSGISIRGFHTACEKPTVRSKLPLLNTKDIWNDVETERLDHKLHHKIDLHNNFSFQGFQTANGRHIEISETSLKKARDILSDIEPLGPETNLQYDMGTNVIFQGCQTDNEDVNMCEKSFNKARNVLNDKETMITHRSSNLNDKTNEENVQANRICYDSFGGFKTANGKSVKISDASLRKAKLMLEEESNIGGEMSTSYNFQKNVKEDENNYSHYNFKGFQTAGGKSVQISDKSLSEAKKLLDEENKSWNSNKSADFDLINIGINDITPFQGIVRKGSLRKPSRSTELLLDNDLLDVSEAVLESDQFIDNPTLESHSNTLFYGTPGSILLDDKLKNNVCCSKLLKTPTKNLSNHLSVISEDDLSLLNQSLPAKSNYSNSSHQNKQTIKRDFSMMSPSTAREVSESMAALMADEACDSPLKLKPCLSSPTMIFDRHSKLPTINCYEDDARLINAERLSPVLNEYTHFKPVSKVKHCIIKTSNESKGWFDSTTTTPYTKMFAGAPLYATSTPNASTSKAQVKRVLENDLAPDVEKRDKTQADECCRKIKSTHNNVIEARRKAAAEQEYRILKKGSSVKPIKSTLFLKKETEKRTKLCDLLDGSLQLPNEVKLKRFDIKTAIMETTASNALDFKFVGNDYFSGKILSNNIGGIPVGDGALLILNEEGEAGVDEFIRALFDSHGVDPVLISKEWIKNHFKWITLKLASMERIFPEIYGNRCLTPNNVMLQLKYRYDREIDLCQRSAIRKILEKDECPAKTMVLFVAAIHVVQITENSNNEKKELELCDGWYSMKATIDYEMEVFILRNIVSIGTKIVISGADVINNDSGCHPLEMPPNVRLRVSTNSCRRARWYARLGFYGKNLPAVTLRGVLGRGGIIPLLSAVVARTYPTLFLEKLSGGKSVLRGERAEQTAADLHLNKRQQAAETILGQLQKSNVDKSKRNQRQPVPIRAIQSVNDEHELLSVLEGVEDWSMYQDVLTSQQINIIQEYKQQEASKLQQQLQDKLSKKLDDQVPQRSVTRLLKVRLCCSESNQSALLSLWNPSDDVMDLLVEGSSVIFHHVSASGYNRFGDLQLVGGRHTKYSVVSHHPLVQTTTLLETLNKVDFKPPFAEIDVVGVVVPSPDNNNKQIYIADTSHNILVISFAVDLKDTGFASVMSPGSLVAGSSLHWRSNVVSWSLPTAFATELSTFSHHPRQEHLQQALTHLRNSTKTLDLPLFIDDCVTKIKDLVAKRNSGGVTCSTPVQPSTSLHNGSRCSALNTDCTSVGLANDSPLDRKLCLLERFGEPPPIMSLQINTPSRLKRSFRPPLKTQQPKNR